jgi:succinyl-diaminopimelate desuccinylase
VPNLTETLAWLVDIPSETGNESAIRDEIADRLARFPSIKVGKSLVVGTPREGSVLLVGHTDTVPLQGHEGARIEGDRLYGLGATDMKSGLAVMIHLLEDLDDERLVGIFYAGEEGPIGGNDLGLILDALPLLEKADVGIVMEPTDQEMHLGCQGSVNATVSFRGEASHSARPWLGLNAVTRAGEFLTSMDGLKPEVHEIEGLRFKEVISVTSAAGGVANNIIPSRFELNVNYRFSPDRSLDEAIEHLRDVCSEADDFAVFDTAPAAYPEASHPLLVKLAEVSGNKISHKQGWTDVAQLAQRGVPGVNFGPGETALAHKPGESVALADLDWAYSSLSTVLP